MKFLSFLLITSFIFANLVFSQNIKGNGNIVKKDYQISGIEKISNLTSANIILTQSQTESLTLELDENLIQYFDNNIDNNEIVIKLNKKKASPTKFNVYFNIKNLKEISNLGSGNISSTNTIFSDKFELNNTGSGNTNLTINGNGLEANITGSGNGNIVTNAEKCEINHTGSGNLKLNLDKSTSVFDYSSTGSGNSDLEINCKTLGISSTGSGDVILKGKSELIKLESMGSGDINGNTFTSEKCSVEINGSGDVNFTCNKEADIDLNGSGDLKLAGDYRVNKISMTGSGKLIK